MTKKLRLDSQNPKKKKNKGKVYPSAVKLRKGIF